MRSRSFHCRQTKNLQFKWKLCRSRKGDEVLLLDEQIIYYNLQLRLLGFWYLLNIETLQYITAVMSFLLLTSSFYLLHLFKSLDLFLLPGFNDFSSFVVFCFFVFCFMWWGVVLIIFLSFDVTYLVLTV